MEFIFNGNTSAIQGAELSATIVNPAWQRKYEPEGDPRLFWTLEVWTEAEVDDDVCELGATAQEMRFPISRWQDLAAQTAEWEQPNDKKVSGPYGSFYLRMHDTIRSARVRFTERDGNAFRFEWEGLCNVLLDEYRIDQPFSASGWATFTGVMVQGNGSDTDESLRGRLSENLDPGDFVQGPLISRRLRHSFFRRETVAHAVFTPR